MGRGAAQLPANRYLIPVKGLQPQLHFSERNQINEGVRTFYNVGTIWTDDRGFYHLGYVEPGNYCLKIAGMRGGTETHFGLYAMHYAPWEGFSPVYYGGAPDISSATLIPVVAGARVRVDFQLELQPTFKIRGRVQGFSASEPLSFELLRGTDRTEPSRAQLDVSTGEFEVWDVTPGSYRLRAAQGKMRGEVSVNVGGADLDDVLITPQLAKTVNFSSRSVGSRPDSLSLSGVCDVDLRQRWYAYPVYSPNWDDGQTRFEGMLPGDYDVLFRCTGAYVQSASFGGADLLTNPLVTIPSDGPAPSIEIQYTPGGGHLNVTLEKQIPPQGGVLLVPTFSESIGPELESADAFGPELGGRDVFQFSNLAPGDYVVYVLQSFENAEFRNPAFLQDLSGGTTVHVEDGKTAEVAVTGASK